MKDKIIQITGIINKVSATTEFNSLTSQEIAIKEADGQIWEVFIMPATFNENDIDKLIQVEARVDLLTADLDGKMKMFLAHESYKFLHHGT